MEDLVRPLPRPPGFYDSSEGPEPVKEETSTRKKQ